MKSILSVIAHCIVVPTNLPNSGLLETIQNQPKKKAVR